MRAGPLSILRTSRVLLVAAHPDDEILSASSILAANPQVTVVHTTDGSPRNLFDAQQHGFHTATEYAQERRRELREALSVLGAELELVELGFADQESARNLAEMTARLQQVIREVRPEAVLTHPYEGGHPDHDACAFAAHRAAANLPLLEFTSYHAGPNGIRTGGFLDGDGEEVRFSGEESARKDRVLACFRTQQETLAQFGRTGERFRFAPSYDFAASPHPGELFYEHFDWGMTGAEFRRLAARALAQLRMPA